MVMERVLVSFQSLNKVDTRPTERKLNRVRKVGNSVTGTFNRGLSPALSSANNMFSNLRSSAGEFASGVTNEISNVSNVSQSSIDRLQEFTQTTRNVNDEGDGFTDQLTNMNMAMLGVMFAGMQLSMVMGGLFKPVKQAFGVGDMFSSMLTSLMAPAFSLIMPLITDLVTFVMDLSDGWKIAIAAVLGAVAAIGKLMFIFGSFFLFLNSFLQIQPQLKFVFGILKHGFGLLSSVVKIAGSALMSLGSTILKIITGPVGVLIAAFGATVAILKLVESKFGFVAKVITGVVLAAVAALIAVFASGPLAIAAAIGIIIGILFAFRDDVGRIWKAIKKAGKAAFTAVSNWVEEKIDAAMDKIKSFKEMVVDAVMAAKDLLEKIGQFSGSALSGFSNGVRGAVGGLFNDFIMTDNGMQRISPNDELALIGTKGGTGMGGGGGGNDITINVDVDTVTERQHTRDIADEVEERLKTRLDGRTL